MKANLWWGEAIFAIVLYHFALINFTELKWELKGRVNCLWLMGFDACCAHQRLSKFRVLLFMLLVGDWSVVGLELSRQKRRDSY